MMTAVPAGGTSEEGDTSEEGGTSPVIARLFDADRVDRVLELGPETAASVEDRQLLWVDLTLSGDPPESPIPLDWLPFPSEEIGRAWSASPQPRLTVHGSYFFARLIVLLADEAGETPEVLDLAVGRNVVLTAHRSPIPFLTDLNGRITADTSLGEIDSADFASVLVDGVTTSYLERTDAILARVDELDGDALKSTGRDDLLDDLVTLRHRIAATRRALVAHRAVMVVMAGAAFEVVTEAGDGQRERRRFDGVTERFGGAVDAIDAAREALIGTFDIYMSRTAQRTNDVVKILTVVTVLLLPAGVIAGFMGMNVQGPYSEDDPLAFWIVLLLTVGLAAGTLATLRLRRWL